MLKMVDGTGIIGVDMVCPLGVSTPQPPNYDRVELEGTGILVLPNSLDAPLERLELGGKTEQVQTTGAQLITLANRTDVGDTELGGKKWLTKISEQAYSVYNNYQKSTVEFMGNNSFKLSHNTGASSTNGNGLELPVKIKPDTDYTLSYTSSISEVLVYFIQMDSGCNKLKETSSRNKKHTFHSEANAEWVILKFASVLNNSYVVSNIQFEKGTVATSFEPYTGGKPSPSPEYPQEIKNSGKWNEGTQKYEVDAKVTGKNLLNLQKEPDVKGTYQGWKVGNGELLTLGVKDKGNNADIKGCYIGFSNQGSEPNGVIWVVDNGVIKAYPLTQRKAYVSIYPNNETTVKKLTERLDIQCELGNVATPYQPYKEQILTITSDRPLTKWDRLVEQGGQIGWLYNTDKYIVTGQESFETKPSYVMEETVDFAFMNNKQSGIRKAADNFCNRLTYVDSVWSKHDVGFGISGAEVHIRLPLEAIGASSSDESAVIKTKFSEYLKKKYDGGGPFVFYHKSKTTEFIPIPQSEQNAIRALKTYYPTTVITADGGELDPDIKVTYRKEI